jgi:hypothetical protein
MLKWGKKEEGRKEGRKEGRRRLTYILYVLESVDYERL